MSSGPLDGIRILDFTQIIAGPLGCMLLSDLGAEVIKVEPLEGEPWRLTSQFMPNESKAYQSLNRGKQSIAMDLTNPTCQEAIHRLVRTCDVVVINARPDVAERLQIDYESLKKERPDLIYMDSTAFGREGPWAHRPGYDIVAQAASGLLMVRGHLDERGYPALSGNTAPADFTTGYAIAWGVCAALFHRQRTGRGQMVETSLLINALTIQTSSFMSLPIVDSERRDSFLSDLRDSRAAAEPFDQFVRRRKVRETIGGGGIYYRGYLTKDGALAVGCLSPTTREKMNHALGIDGETDIRNARSVTADLIARVEAMMREKTTDEWMELFDRNGVPASPVWFVEELQENPQVVANDYVVELEHDLTGPQTMSASPFKMSDSPPMVQGAAPPLGRDTGKWLEELGYSTEEVEALAAAGAIGMGP